MQKVSRRTFTRHLLAAGLLPSTAILARTEHNPDESPTKAAGYTMTDTETGLAKTFLVNHNKNMESLRTRDLPNSLAPYFCQSFAPPRSGKKS